MTVVYSNSCTKSPLRSLGSNQVLLGGMTCAGVGDGHELVERRRVEREGDGHLARVHPALELRRAADAADEVDPLVGARVADAEDRPEDPVLQQGDVERADRIVAVDRRRVELEQVPGAGR